MFAGGKAVGNVEHAAVGYNQHAATLVPAGDVFEGGADAGGKFAQVFTAAGKGEFRVAAFEAVIIMGEARLRFNVGQGLEGAEITLAQAGVEAGGEAATVCDRFSGLAGAGQVRAVGRVKALGSQTGCGGAGLGQPGFIERDVGMPLEAAFGVPGGFTVADEADAGGHCGSAVGMESRE